MEIIWTKLARITYVEVLENLKIRWTIKEMTKFVDLTDEVLSKIKSKNIEFPFKNENLQVRKVIIHKNVSLYYKEENQKVYLITFFNNRMNPDTLKKLLNNQ